MFRAVPLGDKPIGIVDLPLDPSSEGLAPIGSLIRLSDREVTIDGLLRDADEPGRSSLGLRRRARSEMIRAEPKQWSADAPAPRTLPSRAVGASVLASF